MGWGEIRVWKQWNQFLLCGMDAQNASCTYMQKKTSSRLINIFPPNVIDPSNFVRHDPKEFKFCIAKNHLEESTCWITFIGPDGSSSEVMNFATRLQFFNPSQL